MAGVDYNTGYSASAEEAFGNLQARREIERERVDGKNSRGKRELLFRVFGDFVGSSGLSIR
jgi:hypothetical protein